MKWFGESWGAPINESNEQVEVPVDRSCVVCFDPIKKGDRGLLLPFSGGPEDPPTLPYHLRCFGKAVGIKPKVEDKCEHPGEPREAKVGRRVHLQCKKCKEWYR